MLCSVLVYVWPYVCVCVCVFTVCTIIYLLRNVGPLERCLDTRTMEGSSLGQQIASSGRQRLHCHYSVIACWHPAACVRSGVAVEDERVVSMQTI